MENDEYLTKDMYIATSLLSLKVPFIRKKKEYSRFEKDPVYFVFADKKRCTEIAYSWHRGDLFVNAVDFATALKRIKNIIYADN